MAHALTFRRRWLNEVLGGWLLAPLVLTDFAEYRRRHWDHHRHLGTAKDPKLVYRTNIKGAGLLALGVRCAVGLEALRRLTEKPEEVEPRADSGKSATLSPRLFLAHGLFFGSLFAVAYLSHNDLQPALLAAGLAYAVVYGYGLGAITIFAAALRAIAEHQIYDSIDGQQGAAALRNLKCNPLTRLLFGAYGFGEHATHHLRPAVPYYSLPALTTELVGGDATLVARRGYLGAVLNCARTSAGAQPVVARRQD